MPTTQPARANDALACPMRHGELRLLRSHAYGGRRLYAELYVYECLKDGTVYRTREGLRGHGPDNVSDYLSGDSLTPAPRTPAPAPHTDAIAIPEPDSD